MNTAQLEKAGPMARNELLEVLARAHYASDSKTVCTVFRDTQELWHRLHDVPATEALPLTDNTIQFTYADGRVHTVPQDRVYAVVINSQRCDCFEREREAMRTGVPMREVRR